MRLTSMALIATMLFTRVAFAATLEAGQMPAEVKLDGDLGGRVNGSPWSSAELAKTGKVTSLFYVDPEERKLNEELETAYDREKLPLEKHDSVAVINMAAAWYPNSMIASMLKKKQDQFPSTIYVKDLKKTLVKEWGLQDDSVNLVVFGKDGRVIFVKKGRMSAEEIPGLMKIIRENM